MDIAAFTDFYQKHYSLALTVAQQRLSGLSDAEDVAAQAFRIAWAHHAAGNRLSLPWLYQVVRNLIGNEYRRLARADDFVHAVTPLIEEHTDELANDDVREIRRCIRLLPEETRELLYMAYWEGLSGREIAQIHGSTEPAIRLRLMRARIKLKSILANSTNRTKQEVGTDDGRS